MVGRVEFSADAFNPEARFSPPSVMPAGLNAPSGVREGGAHTVTHARTGHAVSMRGFAAACLSLSHCGAHFVNVCTPLLKLHPKAAWGEGSGMGLSSCLLHRGTGVTSGLHLGF